MTAEGSSSLVIEIPGIRGFDPARRGGEVVAELGAAEVTEKALELRAARGGGVDVVMLLRHRRRQRRRRRRARCQRHRRHPRRGGGNAGTATGGRGRCKNRRRACPELTAARSSNFCPLTPYTDSYSPLQNRPTNKGRPTRIEAYKDTDGPAIWATPGITLDTLTPMASSTFNRSDGKPPPPFVGAQRSQDLAFARQPTFRVWTSSCSCAAGGDDDDDVEHRISVTVGIRAVEAATPARPPEA
uniref:Uncharacterized protein n=1 Tax=Oryza barthii TaxID=65489 RepID=A0A0D3F6G7_9ORYZ